MNVTQAVTLFFPPQQTTRMPSSLHSTSSSTPESLSSLQRLAAQDQHHAGRSGFRLFAHGGEAFALRAVTADQARSTLDIQTYILEDGHSTRRLITRIIDAAERGVTVRLLVDDLSVGGLQKRLAMLDAHPRVSVRIFNPVRHWRRVAPLRWLTFALQAHRLHRRMHNKLWLVDDAIGIVGGRNLSDDYFNVNPAHDFLDIDVAAVGGPAVAQMKRSFEAYWQHELAVPLTTFITAPEGDWREMYALCHRSAKATRYTQSLDALCARSLDSLLSPLTWATSSVVWDSPDAAGAAGLPPIGLRMSHAVGQALSSVQRRLLVISGYFVPEQLDTIDIFGLAHRGVQISVLTNALEASDVPIVHGGYAPHRKALLEAGVKLYEVRRKQRVKRERLHRRRHAHSRPRLSPSQSYSLHAKAMALDSDRLIVGSFNIDPRSVWWNCEIVAIIDSPALNRQLTLIGEWGKQPRYSFRVRLYEGALQWRTLDDHGHSQVLTREPGSPWRRFQAWCCARLGLARYL